MRNISRILKFGGSLAVFTALVCGGAWFVQQNTDYIFLSEHFLPLTIFLFGITWIAYGVSFVGIAGKPEFGVFGILGGLVLKMIISLSFFIFLLYRFPVENKVVFALNFFCIYFFLTCFEVNILLRNLRRKLK